MPKRWVVTLGMLALLAYPRPVSADPDPVVTLAPAPPTLEPIKTLDGHGGRVRAVAFGKQGRILVSGGSGRRLRIWDAKTYALKASWRAEANPRYEP